MKPYQHWISFFIFVTATLYIFNIIFDGFQITNNFYLYAYEPWAHHIKPQLGFYNYMLSDDMDVMSVGFPANDQFRQGKFPLWNQYWQLGFNGFRIDSGWFYPLRWLWIIFDIELGMTLEVIIRHVLGAFFTYLTLQRMNITWIVSVVAAIGYSFGSTAIGDYMYGFGPISLALPIMLYLLERLIQQRKPIDLILVVLGWIYINSHIMIHVNFLCSIWLFLYVLLRILYEDGKLLLLKRLLITAITSSLVFAFAILPTLDFYLTYFNDSYRADYSSLQINPASFLTLFYNSFFGIPLLERERYFFGSYTGSAIFIGFLSGLGVLGLSCIRLIAKPDKFIVPVIIISILSILTTYQFPYEKLEFFFKYIPILKHTPPYYQRPICQFYLLMAGALGLDFLVRNFSSNLLRTLSLTNLSVLTALSFITYRVYYYSVGASDLSETYYQSTTFIHFAVLFSFITYCYFLNRNSQNILRSSIIALSSSIMVVGTIYESYLNCDKWIPYSKSGNWNPPTETTDFLKTNMEQGERIITLDSFAVPGLLFSYSIPIAAGRALPQKEYLELLRLAAPNLYKDHPTQSFFEIKNTDLLSPVWDLINVNYFLASIEIDRNHVLDKYGNNFKINYLNDGVILEKLKKSLPYVISNKVSKFNTLEEVISTFKEVGLADGLLTYDPKFRNDANTKNCSLSAEVTELKINANSYSVKINHLENEPNCTFYFMPSFAYDKGWHAYLNGSEIEIYTAYGLFPFIKINGEGTSIIEFSYQPRYLVIGFCISLIGIITLFCFFLKEKRE